MSSNEPLLALKHTNVSRPQIQHSASQQSISASEDYYTVDEISSESGDDRSNITIVRNTTPPEQYHTPLQSHEQIAYPTHLSTVPEARQSREANTAVPRSVNFDERAIASSSRGMPTDPRRKGTMDSESLSTTPGVDDTPYIRFAIDQLTRDEEVRGSRKYPAGARGASSEDYPVQRLVSGEGYAHVPQNPPPQLAPNRNPARPPPMEPLAVNRDIFVPYHPPYKSVQFPPLNFVPSILRPIWLGTFTLLCIFMIVLLIVSAVMSDTYSGILNYGSMGDAKYFLFQYLPTMLGMILLVWLHQIAAALQRISPFMALASDTSKSRSEGVFLDLYPTQFLYPTIQHFRAGQPIIGAFSIVAWMFLFTIPLLGSSYNVRWQPDYGTGQWRWLAVQGVVWTVVVLYILLVISLILVFVQLRQPTGLKWDPRSIADFTALLERSNVISDYNETEAFAKSSEFRERLAARTDRLGYWNTSRRPNDIFYGIGEPGGGTRRYTVEHGKIREKAPESTFAAPGSDLEAAQPGDIRMDIRAESVRRRYLPWFLTDTYAIAWIIVAVILYVAFLVVSFVNNMVINGFLPRVPVVANSAGFSGSNFLYSFLPVLLAMILYLVFQTLDLALRRLAPFEALSTPGGASAERSILLDYPARFPVSVTLAAASNHHWRVALFSSVNLMSAFTLPVLASGLFFTQYYPSDGEIRVAAHPAAYYALCVFLAIYVVTVCTIATGRSDMALPHESRNLAETISWLYQSRLLTDRAFSRPATKAELVARLMGPVYLDAGFTRSIRSLITPGGGSKSNLRAAAEKQKKYQDEVAASFVLPTAGGYGGRRSQQQEGTWASPRSEFQTGPPPPDAQQEGLQSLVAEKRRSLTDPASIMYGFGVHWGRDGREHLGIDRVQRGEGRMMHFD